MNKKKSLANSLCAHNATYLLTVLKKAEAMSYLDSKYGIKTFVKQAPELNVPELIVHSDASEL
jgi:hypothetical protein